MVHASADPLVKAGFAAHPFHPETMAEFDEDEEAQYELINEVGGGQVWQKYKNNHSKHCIIDSSTVAVLLPNPWRQ